MEDLSSTLNVQWCPLAFREETARRLRLSGSGALMKSLPSMLSLRSIYTMQAYFTREPWASR